MITKKLKTCEFNWDGKAMRVVVWLDGGEAEYVHLNRVQLKSLSRFIFRVLTSRERKHENKK